MHNMSHQSHSSASSRSLIVLSALLTLISVACADLEDMDQMSTEKNSFGASQHVYYSCETATIDSNGSKWVYQTDEIMNLMDRVQLRVMQDQNDYGVHTLPKIATDTFSDGNLKVRLVQRGSEKSIEVQHQNTGLFASAANGWCSYDNRAPEGSVLPTPNSNESYDLFKVEVDQECVNPCSFVMSTNLQISRVVYEVDGWVIGESSDTGHRFAISYTFNTFGSRSVKATGIDQYGNAVASNSRSFVVKSPQGSSPQGSWGSTTGSRSALDVPYFYQYNNSLSPGSSCQNTSIAMVLSFLGASVTPDQITSRFGKDRAQSVSGLNQVFNQLASEFGVRRINSTSNGSFADLRAALDQGSPVIIHGYFTSYGHVIVVTGYDGSGYYVNDPAGAWSQRFKGGYGGSSSTSGRGAYYPRAAFEAAVGTYDGYSAAPLWMHSL